MSPRHSTSPRSSVAVGASAGVAVRSATSARLRSAVTSANGGSVGSRVKRGSVLDQPLVAVGDRKAGLLDITARLDRLLEPPAVDDGLGIDLS